MSWDGSPWLGATVAAWRPAWPAAEAAVVDPFATPAWSLSGSSGTFSRSSQGGYYTVAGTWTLAAADTRRDDHDPIALTRRGWLIEHAMTNLMSNPLALDNAAWTKSNVTITANAANFIDGAATLDRILETTNNSAHVVNQAITLTSAQPYAHSFFFKPAGRDYADSNATATFTTNPRTMFTGTGAGSVNVLQGNPAPTGRITQHAQGLYRAQAVITPSSSGSSNIRTELSTDGTTTSYTGNASLGIDAGGFQLEAGPFATSFFDGARSADAWTLTTSDITGWSGTAGTFVITGRTPGIGTRPLVALDDGTSSNRIELRTEGTALHLLVVAGGVTQADVNLGAVTGYTEFKAAITVSANAFAGSLAGAAEVRDSAGSMPTVTGARVGANQAGDVLCGHVKAINYYPAAANAAQLQALAA